MDNLLSMPEENDTIGYLDDDGEPLEITTTVLQLFKSFVCKTGQLVFEVETPDGEVLMIIQHEVTDFPYTDYIEYLG